MIEKIHLNAYDGWVCVCGNTPSDAGFYPCDESGNEVEPTEKEWHTNCYVCAHCGRIINAKSLKVVKRVDLEGIEWLI